MNTNRLIPVSSTVVVGTVITTTNEKLIEIKNGSGGGKEVEDSRKCPSLGGRQGEDHIDMRI